jgi:hypothetical protein
MAVPRPSTADTFISAPSMAPVPFAQEYCFVATGGLSMSKAKGSKTKGSSDEAIGRPDEWREGRYQRGGDPVDRSVDKPPETDQPHDAVSTPVTRKDYSELERPPADQKPGSTSKRRGGA